MLQYKIVNNNNSVINNNNNNNNNNNKSKNVSSMLAHGKQRQRRNITIITASTANKLGSDVFTGKLTPT
jgi:hypothetical protein